MRKIMLPQQIFSIVVAIRRAHHTMDVLLSWLHGIGAEPAEICGALVVKLNQDHGALYAVIKNAVGLRTANPREPGVIQVTVHLVHLYPGMALSLIDM